MTAQNPDQTRLAIATLFACTAVAMEEVSPGFSQRFEAAMKEAWHHLRDNTGPNISNAGATETLNWTREMIAIVKSQG